MLQMYVETLDEDYRVSMVNERSEHKAYGFCFLLVKFCKDLKRVNVKKLLQSEQQFFCTGSTLLPQFEACFHFILLPDRSKTRAYFGSLNNGPKQGKLSQKGYHSLPFAAKVSVRCSFEQFHNLNKRQGSFPHNSITPLTYTNERFF